MSGLRGVRYFGDSLKGERADDLCTAWLRKNSHLKIRKIIPMFDTDSGGCSYHAYSVEYEGTPVGTKQNPGKKPGLAVVKNVAKVAPQAKKPKLASVKKVKLW